MSGLYRENASPSLQAWLSTNHDTLQPYRDLIMNRKEILASTLGPVSRNFNKTDSPQIQDTLQT